MAVTVSYAEVSGSPTHETWGDGGSFEAERILRCAWSERHKLAIQLKGTIGGVVVAPTGYPSLSFAIVRDVKIRPEGERVTSTSGLNTYEYALLSVQYATHSPTARGGQSVTYDDGNGVVVEETFDPSAEFMTIGVSGLNWSTPATAAGALQEVEAPSRMLRTLDISITRYRTAQPDPDENSYMGCVNSEIITSIATGQQFAAGTLLFLGVTMSVSYDENGDTNWTTVHRFTYKPTGWNLFPRPQYAAPQAIYNADGTQFLPYTAIDFLGVLSVVFATD